MMVHRLVVTLLAATLAVAASAQTYYKWTDAMMRIAGDQVDGLSLHYYTLPGGGWPPHTDPIHFDETGWADAVWAGEVLEHVVDVVGLLLEARRALAPGGRVVATTPAHGPVLTRVSHLEPFADHVRFFTARSLRAVFDAAGFERVEVKRRRGRLWACAS